MRESDGGYRLILVPEDAERTRTFSISRRMIRLAAVLGAAGVVVLAVVLASWWYFAVQAAKVPDLQREVARLEAEVAKVDRLAQTLERVESEYSKVRTMLGADVLATAAPPEMLRAETESQPNDPADEATGLSPEIPTSWPLATSGFVTRPHRSTGSDGSSHPGLDIAVAQDSYIRAAGPGVVREAGYDSIYGRFILIEHGRSGYSSMYGHASRLFVAAGDTVRKNQVIALSGNTGRSTAPHLHFEIHQDGRPVDPFTLVQQGTSSSTSPSP